MYVMLDVLPLSSSNQWHLVFLLALFVFEPISSLARIYSNNHALCFQLKLILFDDSLLFCIHFFRRIKTMKKKKNDTFVLRAVEPQFMIIFKVIVFVRNLDKANKKLHSFFRRTKAGRCPKNVEMIFVFSKNNSSKVE